MPDALPLRLAVGLNSPGLVYQALQGGAAANGGADGVSLLHDALLRRTEMHNLLAKGIFNTPIELCSLRFENLVKMVRQTTDTRTARDKAGVIAHLLITYGARLDRRTDDCPIAPADDPVVWEDTAFARDIWISGLYAAQKRGEATPRFNPEEMQTMIVLICQYEGGKSLRHEVTAGFNAIGHIRSLVGQRLQSPQTPVEQVVARALSPDDRAYWQAAYRTSCLRIK